MYEILNNWKVVILSLGGATTFWFFNELNKDFNAVINYPIEFQFSPDSVVIVEPLPEIVTIDVSSGGWNLIRNTLFFNVTPIQIELENPTEISYFTRSSIFPLVTDQLSALEINYLVTDTLHINIEQLKTKKVAVAVDSSAISLESGYRLTSSIQLKPDSVTFTGPKSFIDHLSSPFLIPLSDEEIDDPYNGKESVPVPKNGLVEVKPKNVRIRFEVEEFERLSVSVPIETVNFPTDSSAYLLQSSVDIFFTVRSSDKDDFSAADFAITADLAMLSTDSTVLAMLMYHPDYLSEIEVFPENIKIGSVH